MASRYPHSASAGAPTPTHWGRGLGKLEEDRQVGFGTANEADPWLGTVVTRRDLGTSRLRPGFGKASVSQGVLGAEGLSGGRGGCRQPTMPTSFSKTVEEPCEDWEDLDYDAAGSQPLEDLNTTSHSTNSTQVSDLSTTESSNALLWTTANKNPQYVIIPAPSSTSNPTSTVSQRPLPQNAIFGTPALTILKRPSPSFANSKRSTSPTASPAVEFKQREKAYLEARDRIFGQTPAERDSLKRPNLKLQRASATSSKDSEPERSLNVERQPNGPDLDNSKGFKNRNRPSING
ncbi:hypothetical protein CROQUDRAFT_102824 [Cronartium quercuum f. sp. fusiforme G11]|uniref:SUZ domain-containing protein n=1 Tax=Cronartium quercuum f. sp. fusiforme G11 TaxID=708437 RepID=A0A9P6NZF3_9BASI|nr:hypothetical protein CROQUDRAFT_102824 [Cronartium quercuum f. sp. fusiforme G11]